MKNIFPTVLMGCLLFSACGNGGNNSGGDSTSANTEAIAKTSECDSCIKIITAHKFIKADKVTEFIEFTKDAITKSRAEEGNISYTLYQDPSDPTKFMFYEQWKNQAAIDYHFSTEHFKLSGSRASEFESAPTIITIYDACEKK